MPLISFDHFNRIYRSIVEEVYQHWTPEMQWEMSLHCYSWNPGLFNFKTYLLASSVRYYRAYCSFSENQSYHTVCDIGGFWGVFAMTLKSLGFEVSLTETLKYYGSSFDALFQLIRGRGVTIIDYDPFGSAPSPGQFDVVTVMAVLEHYPHSLRTFMENATAMMEQKGSLYIEVPNIAYWPKRIKHLWGESPLTSLLHIYLSERPFIGHHHEFTLFELRTLMKLSHLIISKEILYTYSDTKTLWKRLRARPLETIVQLCFPRTRECIAVLCQLDGRKE